MTTEFVHSFKNARAQARLSHSSSLMTNYESGHVADPGQAMHATTDKHGNAMLFTVSPEAGDAPASLYLTYRDEGQKTGWRQIDLNKSFPDPKAHVQTIAVTQFSDGKITVAVAYGAGPTGPSTLIVSPQLSDDPADASWQKLTGNWRTRKIPQALAGFASEQITLSSGASGIQADDGGPLMFVAGKTGGALSYRIVATGPADPDDWPEVLPPDGATNVTQMLAGNTLAAFAGTFTLYDHGKGPEVGFQGAPGASPDGLSQKFTLGVATDTHVIALGAGQQGDGANSNYNSLVTAGPGGLVYYPPLSLKGNASGIALTGAGDIDGIKEIAVIEDLKTDSKMTIWVIDASNTLLYMTMEKSDPAKTIQGPFPFKRAVAQVAPVLNKVRAASEIAVVGEDGKLSYLWQDPTTTLWTESDIPLYTTDELLSFQCYTTTLHFEDDLGRPIAGQGATLRASAWSYVTVNGAAYVLTPDADASVKTDANGAVTIVQKVGSIAVPNYTVTSDVLAGSVVITTSAGIKSKLDQIKSGDDLKNAKSRETGKPLFEDSGAVDFHSAATAIQKLSALHPGQSSSLRAATHAGDFGVGLNLAAHQGTWALVDDGSGRLRHVEGDEAEQHLTEMMAAQPESIFGDIEAAVGDALRWVEHGIEKVAKFVVSVVKDGVQFVIKLAKTTLRFIVNTAEQVLAAITYVLKQIGATLKKLIDLLGLLFEWGDVITTKNALSAYVLKGIDFFDAELDGAEAKVTDFFDGLKEKLADALKLPSDMPTGSMGAQASQQSAKSPQMKSTGASFSNYHLQHSGMATGSAGTTDPVSGLMGWIEDVVGAEIKSIVCDAQTAFDQISALAKEGKLTAEAVIKIIAEFVGDVLLDTVKNIAVGGMKFAQLVLQTIKSALTAKIEIPFLSAFYKSIVGHDLTLLDGIALLVSIPTTLLFKIAAGKAPFTKDEVTAIQNASPKSLFMAQKPAVAANAVLGATPPGIAAYSAIGTIVGGVTGVAGVVMTAMKQQSEGELPLIPKLSLGMSIVGLCLTAPISPGPAYLWTTQGYALSASKTIIKGLGMRSSAASQNPATKLALAQFDAGLAIVLGALAAVPQTGALIVNAENGKNDALSYVSYSCSLLGDVSAITGGLSVFDLEPLSKEGLLAASLATGGVGAFGKLGIGIVKAAEV